ncbi:hypothetical protein R1sor_018719 [Riccia sorocarpa]|uniref:Reverse transcriptase domain-containing protein n=1 Tax=Riccia sorocarpa TaxID=122646 RepID=A0ABD3IAK4_9MARC
MDLDLAEATSQKCIFLKLDFIKAYDRIDQVLLLDTLGAMGFGTQSMKLLKGLTCNGKDKLDERNFNEARNILTRFERASGTRLNINKTTIILLFRGDLPTWLTTTGCQVATAGKIFRYLGILEGTDVLDEEITRDVKLRKLEGGLGWPPLAHMAQAFFLRNITKLITGGEEDWIKIAKAIIHTAMQRSSHTAEVKWWSMEEVLLGITSFQTKISATLDRMLKIWYKMKKLKWLPMPGVHPLNATPKLDSFSLR